MRICCTIPIGQLDRAILRLLEKAGRLYGMVIEMDTSTPDVLFWVRHKDLRGMQVRFPLERVVDVTSRELHLIVELQVAFEGVDAAEGDSMTESVMQMAAERSHLKGCSAIADENGCYYHQPFVYTIKNTANARSVGAWLSHICTSFAVIRAIVQTMIVVADTEALDDAISDLNPFDA